MAWFSLDDIPGQVPGRDVEVVTSDEGLSPTQRAIRLKRYAQKVLRLAQQGRYDPEKTALARMMGLQSARQLEDLPADAFTPAQQAQLARLATSLRAYARQMAHYHTHGASPHLGRLVKRSKYNMLPGGKAARMKPSDFDPVQLRIGTRHEMEHTADPALAREIAMDHLAERADYYSPKRRRRITAVPIQGWEADDDDELGFLPALAPILGAVAGPLLGGLFGGGDKKAAPAAAPAAPVVVPGGSDLNLPAVAGVVADQIRAVPPPVRQQVTDAVREIMDKQKAGQMDVATMMKQIADMLGPKLKEQLTSVNNAALQRQATYEHNALVERDKRWKQNAQAQQRILARLDTMEQKLGGALSADKRRQAAVNKAFGVPPRYQ